MIKSIKFNPKDVVLIILLPLLVEFSFDVFTDEMFGKWDVERYFMYFLYGMGVYIILEIEKPSKTNFFSLIFWLVLFKYQVLIISVIFNVNGYNRQKSIESYHQTVQEPDVETANSTSTNTSGLNSLPQSELTAPKLAERIELPVERFIASDDVNQLQSFHEKVKVVMANANVSAQSLTKEQEMHLMNIGLQLAQYVQRNQWDEFEKIVLAESADCNPPISSSKNN